MTDVAQVVRDQYPDATHFDIMRWRSEGMYAGEEGAETPSIYQQSRIRHFHGIFDNYLGLAR